MPSLTCKHCQQPITAATEDELVERVQAHVRDHASQHANETGRGRAHQVTRQHVLTRLRRQDPNED